MGPSPWALLLGTSYKKQTCRHSCHCVHVVQDVKAVAWHPSGRLLASCSYDDSIKLWSEADDEWACEQTLSGGGVVYSNSCTSLNVRSCIDKGTTPHNLKHAMASHGFRQPPLAKHDCQAHAHRCSSTDGCRMQVFHPGEPASLPLGLHAGGRAASISHRRRSPVKGGQHRLCWAAQDQA